MTNEQEQRYSRHLLLEDFGKDGQEKLLKSKVLIIGAGGLGSPCALYLAAAGVGTIGIADGDVVTLSNLQRQVIHTTADIDRKKVDSAADKMRAMNPDITVVTYPDYINDEDIDALVDQYDFVIEATDNYASRYRVNDACVRRNKPFCIGGVSHYSGQIMTHMPGSATYRDVFPEEPQQATEGAQSPLPVLGPVVGMLGTIMATEAVKALAQTGEVLADRLLTFDAKTMQFNTFNL